MQIADPSQTRVLNEVQFMLETLPFDGACVLELGCGKADKTRLLAESGRAREIIACEVDRIQHAKNLARTDLPAVRFEEAGAEAIPLPDGSVDLVLMFKSLHHVPVARMDEALAEIARVLRPGGLAWISEPVYAGALNEVFKLFHDEAEVRAAAFAALCRSVDSGRFELAAEHFFLTRSYFENFDQFDQRMIQVTHTDHRLEPTVYAQVKAKFESYLGLDGATFLNPQRIDCLRKPT